MMVCVCVCVTDGDQMQAFMLGRDHTAELPTRFRFVFWEISICSELMIPLQLPNAGIADIHHHMSQFSNLLYR